MATEEAGGTACWGASAARTVTALRTAIAMAPIHRARLDPLCCTLPPCLPAANDQNFTRRITAVGSHRITSITSRQIAGT